MKKELYKHKPGVITSTFLTPTNQALGFASFLKPSFRAAKYVYRTLM
jgi:hypothetical protein